MRWLGHPATVAALAVLLVNDHVLKGWATGPAAVATGKLSDVAGVALLALVLGGLTRRPAPSLAIVGGGFLALKVVPGVAELAAPVLGGPTRRDATDLVALVVLVPVGLLLRRPSERPPDAGPGWTARVAAACSAVLPVAVAGTSVLAVTATSCLDPVGVVDVQTVDGGLRAGVGPGYVDGWALSTDGGQTWRPDGEVPDASLGFDGPSGRGPVCTSDQACFRVQPGAGGGVVEQRAADDRWETAFRFDPDQRAALEASEDGRSCPASTRFTAIAARDDVVVVALGDEGVLRRDPDTGAWRRVPVLGVEPSILPGRDDGTRSLPETPPSAIPLLVALALGALGAVLEVVAAAARRRPVSLVAHGTVVLALGVTAYGTLVVLTAGNPDKTGGLALALVAGGAAGAGAFVAVIPPIGRWLSRRRPVPPPPPW